MDHSENKVFLHPGDFHFDGGDTHIHTLLGSCVSITLWHPKKRIGGMCHFVLPKRCNIDGKHKLDGRYADEAMELFERQCKKHGTELPEYHGKIFGGSNMFGGSQGSTQDMIGTRNASTAIQMLTERGINVLVAHVGESGHRRVVFNISNGDVWVRLASPDHHYSTWHDEK